MMKERTTAMDETIVDWNNQTIGVGDTVIYAPGERYHSGMGYFRVISIKTVVRKKYKYNNGNSHWVELDYRQLRLHPLNFKGGDRTITEGENPYAFNSLTKFTAEADVE